MVGPRPALRLRMMTPWKGQPLPFTLNDHELHADGVAGVDIRDGFVSNLR